MRSNKEKAETVTLQCKVEEIILVKWNGLDFISPFAPPPKGDILPPHVPIPVAWCAVEEPVGTLLKLGPDEGLIVRRDIDIVFEVEVLGFRRSISVKRKILTQTYSRAKDIGPEIN